MIHLISAVFVDFKVLIRSSHGIVRVEQTSRATGKVFFDLFGILEAFNSNHL